MGRQADRPNPSGGSRPRSLALAAALSLIAAAASAQPLTRGPGDRPSPITLSIEADSGVLWGMAKELVYVGSYKLSELDYPLQPLAYAGGRIEIGAFGGLDATVRFDAGIPSKSGSMTDSDWDYIDYPPIPPGVQTNFSQSDSYLQRAILFDARIGWKIAASPALVIEPFAAYKYLDIKWSAQNGYLQYPPQASPPYTAWSPSEAKVPLYGTVLTYSQTFMIPAAGIRVIGRVSGSLSIEGSVALSPFAFLNDVDEHPLRYLAFYDSMAGGFYFEPELAVSWQAASNFELTMRLSYLSIVEPNTGTTVMLDTNPNDAQYGIPTLLTGQNSGGTLSAFGAEVGARLRM